jgi:hypothetical protein
MIDKTTTEATKMTGSHLLLPPGRAGNMFHWIAVFSLPIIVLTGLYLLGQSGVLDRGRAACESSALDKTIRFDTDGTNQKIIFGFRNVSEQPCSLRPITGLGLWSIAEHYMTSGMPRCRSCSAGDNGGFARAMSRLPLEPRQSATFTLEWPVAPDAEAASCHNIDDVFLHNDASPTESLVQFTVQQAALRLCDPVTSGAYQVLASDESDRPLPVALNLTPNDTKYFPDEPIEMRLAADDPGHLLGAAFKSCGTLLLMQRVRAPTGDMRFKIINLTSAPSHWQDGFVTTFKSDSSSTIYSDPVVAAKFPDEMEYLAGRGWRAEGGQPSAIEHDAAYISICDHRWQTIATSNVVQVHATDSVTQEPKWGPQSSGFALSVTVDRDAYKLGQDVPLHIACIRNGQDWTVENVYYNPACAPHIEIVDSNGGPAASGYSGPSLQGGQCPINI